jgi:hypothetical protein
MIDDVKIPYYNIVFILFVSFLFVSFLLVCFRRTYSSVG